MLDLRQRGEEVTPSDRLAEDCVEGWDEARQQAQDEAVGAVGERGSACMVSIAE